MKSAAETEESQHALVEVDEAAGGEAADGGVDATSETDGTVKRASLASAPGALPLAGDDQGQSSGRWHLEQLEDLDIEEEHHKSAK